MPGVRDHEPIVIEEFNGWWTRGGPENVPSDHLIQADNIQFVSSGLETRDGLGTYQTTATSLGKILRMYDYVMQTGQTLLVLVHGGFTADVPPKMIGKLYHVKSGTTAPTLILTITEMEDFGFISIAGRAYITPFKTYNDIRGLPYQLGLENEHVYVYLGDDQPARKAGGKRPVPVNPALPPANQFRAVMQAGIQTPPRVAMDIGFHIIAVVYETNTGYLTAPGPVLFTTPMQFGYSGVDFTGPGGATDPNPGEHLLDVFNIPFALPPSSVSDAIITKRHLVSTKTIFEYNGDPAGYQFFFIPGGNIDDNTTTQKLGLGFFDADLIDDASHLTDNFENIPAGVNLNTYHSRMVVVGEFGTHTPDDTLTDLPPGVIDNRSIARVSFPGEPEAISKVDGLLITPLDGNPLTNVQEFRDILYLFKKTRTYAYSDNLDVPASWQEEVLDQGFGAPVHGIATVLDSGGVNIDFLIIANFSGLMQFNGTYARPELSWKVEEAWFAIGENSFNFVQIVNDSIRKKIWITLPEPNKEYLVLVDYSEGMDAKNVKWARWQFLTKISTITLIDTHNLILGSILPFPDLPAVADTSGIYQMLPAQRHDDYYQRDRVTGVISGIVSVKIPDPTIRTAFLGE